MKLLKSLHVASQPRRSSSCCRERRHFVTQSYLTVPYTVMRIDGLRVWPGCFEQTMPDIYRHGGDEGSSSDSIERPPRHLCAERVDCLFDSRKNCPVYRHLCSRSSAQEGRSRDTMRCLPLHCNGSFSCTLARLYCALRTALLA